MARWSETRVGRESRGRTLAYERVVDYAGAAAGSAAASWNPERSVTIDTSQRPPLRLIETGRAEKLVNVRYEDLLRVIGYYIDQHDWHDVLITQIPEGVLLKGIVIDASQKMGRVERVVAVLFTNEDVVRMLEEGLARRAAIPDDKTNDSRRFWRRQ
jgi:hypothetical protein